MTVLAVPAFAVRKSASGQGLSWAGLAEVSPGKTFLARGDTLRLSCAVSVVISVPCGKRAHGWLNHGCQGLVVEVGLVNVFVGMRS